MVGEAGLPVGEGSQRTVSFSQCVVCTELQAFLGHVMSVFVCEGSLWLPSTSHSCASSLKWVSMYEFCRKFSRGQHTLGDFFFSSLGLLIASEYWIEENLPPLLRSVVLNNRALVFRHGQ